MLDDVQVPVDKDVVYLHQFPRNRYVPNLSPFCLKLETFLRVNNINYILRESWTKRSETGHLPFIELNGQTIADSQVIIFHLIKHFKIKETLTPEQAGTARAVDRMIEGSTFFSLMNDKVLNNSSAFVSKGVSGMPVPSFLNKFMAGRLANKVRARISVGIGVLGNDMLMEIMRQDISAVSAILGDKQYLFGNVITLADCTVFGHLASTYYLPFHQNIQELLNKDYQNVRDYVERIRETIYPDLPKAIELTPLSETPPEIRHIPLMKKKRSTKRNKNKE